MTSELKHFLEKRRCKKGDVYSHVNMCNPKGTYYIKNKEELESFWNMYCDNLKKRETPEFEKFGIAEIPQKFSYLRIDFDFKFSLDSGLQRKYTDVHLEKLVSIYQNIIMNIIDPSVYDDKMVYCVVQEKKCPRVSEGFVKDGFHLLFPHFICSKYIQDVYIRNKIMEKLEKERDLEDFRKQVISKVVTKDNPKPSLSLQIEKIVDPIYSKPWLLYGSVKNDDPREDIIWEVTKLFDEAMNPVELKKVFAYTYKKITERVPLASKHGVKHYLPQLLSFTPFAFDDERSTSSVFGDQYEGTKLSDTISQQAVLVQNMQKERKRSNIKNVRSMEESYRDLKKIEDGKLMEMLSDNRVEDYNEWMNVGWTLFNIGQGCDKALQMWVDFSRRSSKFKDGECERAWDKMELRGKTIGSLLTLAKHDNPDEFKKWRDDQIDNTLYNACRQAKPTHFSIASLMKEMYEQQFVCASAKGDLWYEFYNHRWHKVDGGISILKLMPTDVSNRLLGYYNHLTKQIQDPEHEWEKEQLEKRRTLANKILCDLSQTPFCAQVLKMCKIHFHDPKFLEKLNENRDIIVFENGVYDLKQGIFRDGSPDDYMTFSTGTSYYPFFSPNDDSIIELQEYLSKVFVNPKLRNYFVDFICSCFQGGNRNKIFSVFTGEGDAGKSIIVKLLEKVFGDYCLNFPRETFIMGKGTSAGSARPDLARVRGKRIAFVKEIAKNESLHIGMIKEMTGNDSFYARTLFEEGTDISPMFTLVLMCNEPPGIPAHDEATWNRIRVLPFESKFPKPDDSRFTVPENLEDQMKVKMFPQDPHMSDKLDEYVAPLTWLLIQKFKSYYKDGMYEPNEVKMSTQQYKMNNDIYMQFVSEKVRKVDAASGAGATSATQKFIRLTELYNEFKNWYIENHPSYAKEKIGKGQFKKEMNKRISQIGDDGKWHGYEMIDEVKDETRDDGEPEGAPSGADDGGDQDDGFDL